MRITLDIADKQVAEHVLWMLNHFKKGGVTIHKVDVKTSHLQNKPSDESKAENHIKEYWKTLLLQGESDPGYYKSERFKSEKAEFLMEKYK